jgi:hypothetical protein
MIPVKWSVQDNVPRKEVTRGENKQRNRPKMIAFGELVIVRFVCSGR